MREFTEIVVGLAILGGMGWLAFVLFATGHYWALGFFLLFCVPWNEI